MKRKIPEYEAVQEHIAELTTAAASAIDDGKQKLIECKLERDMQNKEFQSQLRRERDLKNKEVQSQRSKFEMEKNRISASESNFKTKHRNEILTLMKRVKMCEHECNSKRANNERIIKFLTHDFTAISYGKTWYITDVKEVNRNKRLVRITYPIRASLVLGDTTYGITMSIKDGTRQIVFELSLIAKGSPVVKRLLHESLLKVITPIILNARSGDYNPPITHNRITGPEESIAQVQISRAKTKTKPNRRRRGGR